MTLYEYSQGFIQQKKLVELRLTNNKIFKVSETNFMFDIYVIHIFNSILKGV